MEQANRKKSKDISDDLIIGKKNIEEFTGKDLSFQFHWISAFDYPLRKRGGYPTISKCEFQEWAKKWGVSDIPPNKITTEMLEKNARKMRIAAMENTPLNNIDEIANAVHRATYTVIDWQKHYDSCPIKKTNRNFSVGKRELIAWLEDLGIEWGHHGIESTR